MSEDPVCRHLSLRDLCPDCIRAAVARIGEPDEEDAPAAFEDQGTLVTGPVRMIRGRVVDRDGERYDPSESEGRACCVECHAEIVVYPEECGMLPEELDGDRHASHTWLVCERTAAVRCLLRGMTMTSDGERVDPSGLYICPACSLDTCVDCDDHLCTHRCFGGSSRAEQQAGIDALIGGSPELRQAQGDAVHAVIATIEPAASKSTMSWRGPRCPRHDKPRELCGPCAREQVRAEQASAVLTAEQVAAIEAREKAATLMPWHRQPSLSIDSCVESVAMSSPMTPSMSADITGDKAREDADFIAHARTDVPRLLATLKARDEEIARLRDQQGEPAPCPPAPSIDDLLSITDDTTPMQDRLREVVGLAIDMRDRWCRIAVDLGWPIGSTPMTPAAAAAQQLTAIRGLVAARPDESTEDAVRRGLEERDAAVRDIVEYLDANEHIPPFRAVSLWPMWDKIRTLATVMSPQRRE